MCLFFFSTSLYLGKNILFLARLHEVHRAIVVTSVVRVYVYVCVRVTLSVKVFIPRHFKKVRGIMLYPPQKISVRVSVRPSVRPSVRQRFVSGLYLEHLWTNFLQTLYRSSYQEGVVWD